MKFDFSKSIDTDFRNKLQAQLDILTSNVLYVTHVVVKIAIIVNELKHDKGLQKQVDDYFEDTKGDLSQYETSPQTDTNEQEG